MSARSLTQVLSTSPELSHIAIEEIIAVLDDRRIDAEDRLEVLIALTRRKAASVFWPVFHAMWRICDETYHARNRLLKVLSSRDAEARSIDYLSSEAKAVFDALPNPFIAFRGCPKGRSMGLSWTTSESIAEQFALGNGLSSVRNPCLAEASVPKSAVFGVYVTGEEAELVINPRRVRLTIHKLEAEGSTSNRASNGSSDWQGLVDQVRRLASGA
jgi:hypothetical protein